MVQFTNYPKHVILILGNEFCERFSFYGMKAILVIFLTRALHYSEDASTSIYHGFNMACYFTPVFGAMLADGLLGKYKTILYVSIVYVVGNLVMSLSAVPFSGIPGDYTAWMTFLGLALIAIGTGGIKPCVNAFGADQFREDQVAEKDSFFSMFYVSINMGSLLSMILTPILRSNARCMGDSCYALAFGIPAALMLLALVFFVVGTRFYTIVPPGNNVIGKMIGCTWTALRERCRTKEKSYDHWLDYAQVKYEESFIEDVKMALRVMFMFLTFPVFWALYDQQGSRWILQAGQMDGTVGNFNIEPDLVPVVNPILVLILVPLCESVVYPLMDRCNCLTTPLKKIGFGMFLCSVSFVVTAGLQIGINDNQPPGVPSGLSRVQPINAATCQLELQLIRDQMGEPLVLPFGQSSEAFDIPYGNETFTATYTNCSGHGASYSESRNLTVDLVSTATYPLVFAKHGEELMTIAYDQTQTSRTLGGQSTFMLINALSYDVDIRIQREGDPEKVDINELKSLGEAKYVDLATGAFSVYVREHNVTDSWAIPVGEVISKAGRVVASVVQEGMDVNVTLVNQELISANNVHILWQLPQYFVMTLSEVFFIITGMNFAYSQAPMTMKAVLQAALLLTSTFGNLMVVIIASTEMSDRVAEFFLFAALMFVTTFVFAGMAHFYTYVELIPESEELEGQDPPAQDRVEPFPRNVEKGSFRRQLSLRRRTRTNSSLYSYLGEGTKL